MIVVFRLSYCSFRAQPDEQESTLDIHRPKANLLLHSAYMGVFS